MLRSLGLICSRLGHWSHVLDLFLSRQYSNRFLSVPFSRHHFHFSNVHFEVLSYPLNCCIKIIRGISPSDSSRWNRKRIFLVLSTQRKCFHTLSSIGIIPALIPLRYLSLEPSSLGIHLVLAMSSVEAWNPSKLRSEEILNSFILNRTSELTCEMRRWDFLPRTVQDK